MSYFRFPKYVSVAEKRAKAEKKIRQLKKKNPDIDPVVIEGRSLTRTWWGKSWNANLERYADYSNRIERGRSYVRHRAVLDLQIDPGSVHALVQGSMSKPYSVQVDIQPLSKNAWNAIIDDCKGKLNSLQDLLEGRLPKELSTIFMAKGSGLFPTPDEIQFSCSCPDWAYMCKHVAATLYGIGARMDRDPTLFFYLRQVNLDDLVERAIADATGSMLEKAEQISDNVIADADLGNVFGIDMDEMPDFGQASTSPKSKNKKTRKTEKTDGSSHGAPRLRKKTDEKTRILERVQMAKSGINAKTLHEKCGIPIVKIRNVLYQAYQKGEIQKVARGVFAGNQPVKRLTPVQREAAVLSVVISTTEGVRSPEIASETGIPLAAVRPVMTRLVKKGSIRRISHGLYGPPAKPRKRRAACATHKIYEIITGHPEGISFTTLLTQSGCEESKLRNIVFRLYKTGRIRRVGRGIYASALL